MNEHEKNNRDILSDMGFRSVGDASESAPESGEKLEGEAQSDIYMSHMSDAETNEYQTPAHVELKETTSGPEAISDTEPPSELKAAAEDSDQNKSIPRPSYMDANFQCKGELITPKTYYTPPKKLEKKVKKEKKGVGAGGFIAACLICALLGGLGGGALVATQTTSPSEPGTYQGNSSLNINTGVPSITPDVSTIATGEKLTGAEIYALGCEQAVGVTTEITYRNYFGAETSTAVSGSGFIVTENGYIVTNYHVIRTAHEGGYDVSVMLYNGESYPAEIVGFEKSNDLAVLKINVTGLPAATLGNSDNILVGDAVYAIGNPLGELSFSMTTGSVSALDRSISTTDSATRETTVNNMFQIDAAVNEGNSGGPVYNAVGEVVGIVTAKYADTGVEGLGFAIPINDVMALIEDLIEYGYVTGKPSFGITAKTVDSVSASYYKIAAGAEVVSINAGSCSEKAGLKVGDIITTMNDVAIQSTNDLLSAKKDYKAGDTVTLKVYREGDYIELTLTFDEESLVLQQGDPEAPESSVEVQPEREKLPIVPKS